MRTYCEWFVHNHNRADPERAMRGPEIYSQKNNNASTTALGNCCQIITSSYIKITIMK
jgi:hypothetical protein